MRVGWWSCLCTEGWGVGTASRRTSQRDGDRAPGGAAHDTAGQQHEGAGRDGDDDGDHAERIDGADVDGVARFDQETSHSAQRNRAGGSSAPGREHQRRRSPARRRRLRRPAHQPQPRGGAREICDRQIPCWVGGEWEGFGVPRTILADNAWENTGSSFVDACADNGISIEWAPVRRPEHKGILERFRGV